MSLYETILSESSKGNLDGVRFQRTRRWPSSNQQPNNSTYTFWELRTNFKYLKFLKCKQMELLFKGSLPLEEASALFDAPGSLTDDLWVDSLSVINSRTVRKETVLQRMQLLQQLLGESPIWTKNLLYTYLGNLNYLLLEIRVPIRKVKKFSGWIRSSSAVGSKKPITRSNDLFSETIENDYSEEKLDFYEFLSVGELYGPSGHLILSHPEEDSKKNRNGKKITH